MIKVVGRSGNLSCLIKHIATPAATTIVPIVEAVPLPNEKKEDKPPTPWVRLTAYNISGTIPKRRDVATHGITTQFQVRYAHTDFKVPNFDDYRKSSGRDPTARTEHVEASRKVFCYAMVGVFGAANIVGGKAAVHLFVKSMSPSKAMLAMAKIEIKLDTIPEGKNMVFKWRGKPLFVRHRSADEVAREKAVDISTLRDPQHDSDRVANPQWLVVIGICTHLGCVPIANQGDFGGYYCPCHGSHYDASGRIRKGPAPLNLEVPPVEYKDDLLIVG